jgi:hypothetical protein
LLDQHHGQPPAGCIAGDADTIDAAANDQKIDGGLTCVTFDPQSSILPFGEAISSLSGRGFETDSGRFDSEEV